MTKSDRVAKLVVVVVEFQPFKKRDASASIRGFVYQVEMTILRWLELVPGQLLELERGEDIDIVSCQGSNVPAARILEQVKLHKGNVTLKSPQATYALACFYAHSRSGEAGAELRFRYVTNSEPGLERPSFCPDGIPGIRVWEMLRAHNSELSNVPELVYGIRQALITAKAPANCDKDIWQMWSHFAQDCDSTSLLEFVNRVEWSTGNQLPEPLEGVIRDRLIQQSLVQVEACDEAYCRLFMFVLKRLCQSGLKRLSPHELTVQLALPTLSGPEQAEFDEFRQSLSSLSSRVTALERTVAAMAERGGSSAVEYALVTAPIEPPPIVEPVIPRKRLEDRYATLIKKASWFALTGGAGIGKTQLANALYRRFQSVGGWIRLNSNLDAHQACIRLDSSIGMIAGVPNDTRIRRDKWYDAALGSLGPGAMLVLDGVPRDLPAGELYLRLQSLGLACGQAHTRVISTSPYALSSILKPVLDHGFHEVSMPILTIDDIREVLALLGAPEELLGQKYISWLQRVTQGYPTQAIAAARTLQSSGWSRGSLRLIADGSYANDLDGQTQYLVSTTVPEGDSRDLLYRLSMVAIPYDYSLVRKVASLPPAISSPREKLEVLMGLWVQPESGTRMLTSPLLRRLGPQNVDISLQCLIHSAAAESITARVMGPYDAYAAILLYEKAGAPESAGWVLLRALASADKNPTLALQSGLLTMWEEYTLSQLLPTGMAAAIRSYQIRLYRALGLDTKRLLADFDSIMGIADDSLLTTVACIQVAILEPELDLRRATEYMPRVLKALRKVEWPETLYQATGMPQVEGLVWVVAAYLRSASDLSDWLKALEQASDSQRAAILAMDLAEDGLRWAFDRAAAQGESRVRDLQLMESISARCDSLGSELLSAAATRALLDTMVQEGQVSRALELAEQRVCTYQDPRALFLVEQGLGSALHIAERNEDALILLDRAINRPIAGYADLRAGANLVCSWIAREEGRSSAADYSRAAFNICSTGDLMDEIALRISCEHVISLFLEKEYLGLVPVWEQVLERLLRVQCDEDWWNALAAVCGHISGYFAAVMSGLGAPLLCRDGTPYAEPRPGMMLRYKEGAKDYFQPEKSYVLAVHLHTMAQSVGLYDASTNWAVRAYEMATQTRDMMFLSTYAPSAIIGLVMRGDLEGALDVAIQDGMALSVGRELRLQGQTVLDAAWDPMSVLGPGPNPKWEQAESWGLRRFSLPVVIYLALVALDDRTVARDLATRAAAVLTARAASVFSRDVWLQSAEAIQEAFSGRLTGNELSRATRRFRSDDTVRLMAYYSAASLTLGPSGAARMHAAMIPYLCRFLGQDDTAYILGPLNLLETYWTRALSLMRAHFILPDLTKTHLQEACRLPPAERAQGIMFVVHAGLGLVPDQQFVDWAESGIAPRPRDDHE